MLRESGLQKTRNVGGELMTKFRRALGQYNLRCLMSLRSPTETLIFTTTKSSNPICKFSTLLSPLNTAENKATPFQFSTWPL